MDFFYVTFFVLSIVILASLIGRSFLEFFGLKTKLPLLFSSQHNLIVGLTAVISIGSIFNSFEINYSNFLLTGCFIVLVYEIARFIRISNGSITSFRTIKKNVNKEFISALFVSCFAIIAGNINYFQNGYRTSGNNDPFDYITLSRVYESPSRTFLNLHAGWSDYADRAGPFSTRLISIIQDALPGNRYIDFLVFVSLTYFFLSLSIISFMRIMNISLPLSTFFTTLILLSPTYGYIFQQGFFMQIWGTSILIVFVSYISLTLVPKGPIFQLISKWNLILVSLFYSVIIFLTYFVFSFIMLVSLVVVLLVMLVRFSQAEQPRGLSQAISTKYVSRSFVVRRVFLSAFILAYCFFFLLDIVQISISFLSEAKNGEYGWSRSAQEYFFDVQGFFPVIDGAIFLVATFIILAPLLSHKRTRWDLFAGLFSIFLCCGFSLFIIQEGISKYQTWKYFSFVLIFLLLFALKNLAEWYVAYFRGSVFVNTFLRFFVFVLVLSLAFFLTRPEWRALVNQKANPSLSVVPVSEINQVANFNNLQLSNVGFYLGSAGETMLIAGLLPSESALYFSDSYYGKPSLDKLEKVEYIFSRFDLIRPEMECQNLVQVSSNYFFVKRDVSKISCFSQILDEIFN
jgi:hypothetical protein